MTRDLQAGSEGVDWPLPRVLALLVTLAYVGLAVDIRLEHVDIVRERWQGWIPIAYALSMAVAGLVGVTRWRATIRRALFWLYALAFGVGGYGFWLHNDGKVAGAMTQALRAWSSTTMKHTDAPPSFAPLAFCGLGMLGLLAMAKRFQPTSVSPSGPRRC